MVDFLRIDVNGNGSDKERTEVRVRQLVVTWNAYAVTSADLSH